MNAINLTVNGKGYNIEADPAMPLLWAIRDMVGLKGTKFGCGMALCGACTVHLDGNPVRSCSVQVSEAAGKKITTIEGISSDRSHPIQKAWIQHQVLSADTVNPVRSCLLLHCLIKIQRQQMKILIMLCREISAGVALISASMTQSKQHQKKYHQHLNKKRWEKLRQT